MSNATATNSIRVSVVTPEGAAWEGDAQSVVVPAFDGEVAFLHGHAPFVGLLGVGEMRVTRTASAGAERFFLSGGVVQVADDEVIVLAELVRPTSALKADEARRELEEANTAPAIGDDALEARLARIEAARVRLRLARG